MRQIAIDQLLALRNVFVLFHRISIAKHMLIIFVFAFYAPVVWIFLLFSVFHFGCYFVSASRSFYFLFLVCVCVFESILQPFLLLFSLHLCVIQIIRFVIV